MTANICNIKDLEALAFERKKQKYPSFPVNYLTREKYSDKTANGLTRAIIDLLRLHGFQAERISSQGRYLDRKKRVTDCLGNTRIIGTGKWIPGSGQKGTADISATINGKSVKIEVKIGRDRQSDAQMKYQEEVESSGGIYIIARTFEEFVKDIKTLI